MIKIEFFNKGRSLGAFPLKERSNQEDRLEVAKVNQIGNFDRFILDDGRVEAWKKEQGYFIYNDELWMISDNTKQSEKL